MRLIHPLVLLALVLLQLSAYAGDPVSRQSPAPTVANVAYGEHPRQVLDFYKADSQGPTPVVFYMHGGGWLNGDKQDIWKRPFEEVLNCGISLVSINYRYVTQAKQAGVEPPVAWPMQDAARALQFVRSKAEKWNLDKKRIAASGTSAGACTALFLAFHDDMVDPTSDDEVASESTRLWCAAVHNAQTTLDPKQMKEWTPNSRYGQHAFGFSYGRSKEDNEKHFNEFLKRRHEVLPWIEEYSPYGHISSNAPPIYLIYDQPPLLGSWQKDPTHTANFGVTLHEELDRIGMACELVYPNAAGVTHASMQAYLVDKLKLVRIALAGDSTVSSYAQSRPDRGWGMYVEDHFDAGSVEVLNFAKPGRSTKTFLKEGHWERLKATQPDYVFIQFGHNDSHASDRPESTDAATDYQTYLRQYIEECRAIKATPILVTPMVRRRFRDDGTLDDILLPYADATKAVGKKMNVPVIDLHRSSWELVESLGPADSAQMANKQGDATHFNEKGAQAMADLVLKELPQAAPRLAEHLRNSRSDK